MSTDPTAEHIDAVADIVCGALGWLRVSAIDRKASRAILTSTDPAVHPSLAASLPAEVMLAALVDRGTLTERRRNFPVWGERPHTACDAGFVLDARPKAHLVGWQEKRQFVTTWEAKP
jgi:hypothetical protein